MDIQCIRDVYCILSSSFLKYLNNDRQQLHQYQKNEKLPHISNNRTQKYMVLEILVLAWDRYWYIKKTVINVFLK